MEAILPFNGVGVFTRLFNWAQDRANGIVVSADRFDGEDNDFATGLSTCITKDGQQTITSDIPWSNHKITGLGNATLRTDALNLGQDQDATAQWSAVTAGTANAITIAPSPAITTYKAGAVFRFKATNTNTAATTISNSGLTARAVQINGSALIGGEIINGASYEVLDDGTNYQLIGVASGTTPTFGDTITIVSTDAGAGVNPTLNLFRNSASPAANDIIGQIRYSGQNSTPSTVLYGQSEIRIDDPTAGTEDSSHIFNLLQNGSTVPILINAFGMSIGSLTAARVSEGRLTLTTGTPVTSSNVAAATTLFFTPYKGNQHAIYNGSRWEIRALPELSIAVPATTTTNYDVFLDYNAGTPALALLAWTNLTTRATALTTQDGILVLTGTLTKKYLGTISTTAVSGQTEDSQANRLVWNYYNRVVRSLLRQETAGSWVYSTNAFRLANGNTANKVTTVCGIAEDIVDLTIIATASETGGTNGVFISANIDSVSPGSITTQISFSLAGVNTSNNIRFCFPPTLGRHDFNWLEAGIGVGTVTWVGTGSSGIFGSCIA